MVNVDRVKAKLPSLLCDGSTTNRKEWAKRHRIENGLKRLRSRKPAKYGSLEILLIRNLEALEKALSEK
ncbi:hypothetical protein E2P42_01510 [Candidatus Bathyarchaeota archaeon]|nr:hypothetical protein E2P42_01510 [Candidatus Bathyarchaeota archaeon]